MTSKIKAQDFTRDKNCAVCGQNLKGTPAGQWTYRIAAPGAMPAPAQFVHVACIKQS